MMQMKMPSGVLSKGNLLKQGYNHTPNIEEMLLAFVQLLDEQEKKHETFCLCYFRRDEEEEAKKNEDERRKNLRNVPLSVGYTLFSLGIFSFFLF